MRTDTPIATKSIRISIALTLTLALVLAIAAATAAPAALAGVPHGMPADVPAAATSPDATLAEPSQSAWPFPSAFPFTSGTGRLDRGALLWSDFIYDDYGASSPEGQNTSTFSQSSGLAGRQGEYVFPPGPAANNGADIFRAGIGLKGGFSYWRVDWVTLADPTVPIAEFALDTDNNPATGSSTWPAAAGVTSPGIDRALVVTSTGAWLINPLTGARTDVTRSGGSLTVDRFSKSFIVAVPNALLPTSGLWRVRLAAGLADSSGQNFAAPYVNNAQSGSSPTAERVYNITFRTVAQEPPVFTSGTSDAQVAAAQAALAGTPVGQQLGLDGLARSVTGNYWMEDDQADTLAQGDVSKFSELVDWSALQKATSTAPPQPTGYSTRWYVSRLAGLGSGQRTNDGSEGDFKPTLLERVQPYAVYVPKSYRAGSATPLTWVEHSLEVNYNQYGALDPQLLQLLCEDRHSICATTEGFGPAGWYFNEAETDFWQVWRALAENFTLDPERTVISGYSMGGWASYKLAFQHPDDFAGALVLDGPLVCGVEVYPGVSGPGAGDTRCNQDGQSQPLVANARWIPYVIDQTYGDELVPTSGVLAQTAAFDALDQRYDLFIHTGGDHLAFAVEDRFSDAVAALGHPVRTTNPGSFTYSWYPDLNDARLGIGATGDYWLAALSARSAAPGTIASIKAQDAALPDPAVTAVRSGTSLVTQPIPGTTSSLKWRLGTRPAAQRKITLALTDVSALAVDTSAARLPAGTLSVTSDGPARLTLKRLPRGTEVLRGARLIAKATSGTATVSLPAGTTVLTLRAPKPAAKRGRHPRPPRPAPHKFSCGKPSGTLNAATLGPVRLGMRRAKVRTLFARSSTRGRLSMDYFCLTGRGIRVGYPSSGLLRSLSPSLRRRVRGTAVLALTSSTHYALRGVRPGTRLARAAARLHPSRGYVVGRNTWYLVALGRGHGVLKVQHGVIAEVGIASPALTRSTRTAQRFFSSFT